jgi:hypothetical protein
VFDIFEAGYLAGANIILKFLTSGFGLYICVDTFANEVELRVSFAW